MNDISTVLSYRSVLNARSIAALRYASHVLLSGSHGHVPGIHVLRLDATYRLGSTYAATVKLHSAMDVYTGPAWKTFLHAPLANANSFLVSCRS